MKFFKVSLCSGGIDFINGTGDIFRKYLGLYFSIRQAGEHVPADVFPDEDVHLPAWSQGSPDT